MCKIDNKIFFNFWFSDVDVNLQDVDGCTALHLASAEDLEGRCVEYLLTHKADALIKDNKVKLSWEKCIEIDSLFGQYA